MLLFQDEDDEEVEAATMIVNKEVYDGTMVVNDEGTMVVNSDNDGTMVINSDQETLQSGMGTMVINDDDDDDDEGTMKSEFIFSQTRTRATRELTSYSYHGLSTSFTEDKCPLSVD